MLTRLILITTLATTFCAAATSSNNISGKWTGTINVHDSGSGTNIVTPVQVLFEQQSSALSGKIGRDDDTDVVPIKNAKVDGDKVYFEATSGETVGAIKFTLTLAGDEMEGEMHGAVDTGDIVGKVRISREKPANR